MACQEKYQCQFLSLIILSVRTDRLSDSAYLSRHWRHYGGMLVFAVLAWMPQVLFPFLLNACLRLTHLVTTGCLNNYFCCVWYHHWILIFSLLIWYSLVFFFRLAGLWLPGTCLFFAELIYGLCGLHFWWACHCYYLLNNFILSIKLVYSIKKWTWVL